MERYEGSPHYTANEQEILSRCPLLAIFLDKHLLAADQKEWMNIFIIHLKPMFESMYLKFGKLGTDAVLEALWHQGTYRAIFNQGIQEKDVKSWLLGLLAMGYELGENPDEKTQFSLSGKIMGTLAILGQLPHDALHTGFYVLITANSITSIVSTGTALFKMGSNQKTESLGGTDSLDIFKDFINGPDFQNPE